MRPGVIVSIVGHIGAVLMTFLAWETRAVIVPSGGSMVPVEIVDVALESNVRALAEEVEDEGESAADESVESDPQPAPAPTPQRPQTRREETFNPDDVDALLNNTDAQEGRRRRDGERSDRNQQGAGLGTDERVTLEARAGAIVAAHLRRCWRMPADLPDPERLTVTVEFDLNRNGTLNGQPRVTSPRNYTFDPYMRVAAEAALRAVRQCDPFPFPDDPVVGEHYEIWRTNQYNFGLRQN